LGGEIRIEREKLRKARLQLKVIKDRIKEEIMIALSDIQKLKRQEEALNAAAQSAEQNVNEVKSLFSNQKATASEVVEAERQLLESLSNQNKAKYSFCRALYALEKSTATPLEKLLSYSVKQENGKPEETDKEYPVIQDNRSKELKWNSLYR